MENKFPTRRQTELLHLVLMSWGKYDTAGMLMKVGRGCQGSTSWCGQLHSNKEGQECD